MSKIIVEQIVSVDGYAADKDGGIGFFGAAGDFSGMQDEQMRMLESVGGILLGANTYRMFSAYWPSADEEIEHVAGPINRLPKYVVSNTLESAPWGDTGEAEILRGDGVASVRALRERSKDDLIVWGSLTLVDALLRARLVDVLRLRAVPIVLGQGRSFAPSDIGDLKLSLQKIDGYPSGHVVTQYAL